MVKLQLNQNKVKQVTVFEGVFFHYNHGVNILIMNWRDVEHPWAGGAEKNSHELAKQWIKLGHKVTLLTSGINKRFIPQKKIIDGITVIRFGGRFTIYLLLPLYYICNDFGTKFDVVLDLENGIPFFTPLYAKTKIFCLVHHVHKNVFFKELPFPLAVVGYLLETIIMPFIYRKQQFICISQSTYMDLKNIGVDPQNITVIYPGVNANPKLPEEEKVLSSKKILYVGRLKRYKRVHLLLDIIKEVRKAVRDAKLIIAGTGDCLNDLKDLVKRNELESFIDILGYVTEQEKHALFQSARVFVNPSSMEGWGISVIEANAHGLPAVAFNVPGLSESICHEDTGFLAENPNEFTDYVIELLTNDIHYLDFRRRAYKHSQNFDWERLANQYLNTFRSS